MHDHLKKLLDNYQPGLETIKKVQSVPKLFLVGISGSGKNTIIERLLTTGKYHLIISHTTREPRKNNGVMEANGVEYNFVDFATIERMLVDKEFVEAKNYALNIYGTSAAEYDKAARAHKVAVVEIEVQGVEEYMTIAPESTNAIFLLPPDFNTWQARFKKRYQENINSVEFNERLKAAKMEIKHALSKDYYSFVVNDNLDEAIKQVELIASGVKQQESLRHHGREVAKQLLIDLGYLGTR